MKSEYSLNVCRVCLENETLQSIYEKDENGLYIYEKIMLCADVQINPKIKWPDKICELCLQNLDISYNFRLKYKSSEEILEQTFAENTIHVKFESSETEEHALQSKVQSVSIDRVEFTRKEYMSMNSTDETDDNHGKIEDKGISENISHKLCNNEQTKNCDDKSESRFMHICEVCGNTYQYKSSLETHVRRHTNEKPFSCEICGRQFVLNGQLTCHMRTHTGEKPYECRYCKRRYADVGARQVHERTHTGERPFKCDICSKTFTYASVLKKHKLTHTDEKKYSCEYCGKKFRLRYHLTAHLNTSKHQNLTVGGESLIKIENIL